ncbi:isochorismatase family protein [Nocardioides pocheonensis]|uniref:Cysteine hydrolase n=1 Tax=Nocardioides pocheonensis TaxID=661485 RepID=A0A3N0GY14_9ACTN|nr:isochorismatase family protein [Nocardioides pocheonensis]RNM17030.1 cysteine hydrolase [Nocardioides pocheonensis]
MSGTVASTTPYSWPYDGRLDPRRLALLVVLPGPEDAESVADGAGAPDSVLGRVGVLAGAMFDVGGVVVEVTTTPPPGRRPERVPAPRRAANLGLRGPAHRITSGGVDGFFSSPLDATLRALGRDQLVLCGQWLETGVHSTMRSANDRGYECLLALDACIPYDPDLAPAARSQIEMSGGIFGAVGDTAAVLAALVP